MKIGIEVELNGRNYHYSTIATHEELSLTEFKTINKLGVKLSKEYYNTTIEYNFFPDEFSPEFIAEVVKYLSGQKEKYGFEINGHSPAFVGTHVHFFDKLKISREKLLNGTLSFILENIDSISQLGINRLIKGHQIWGYWSHRNDHLWLNALNSRGYEVDIYRDTANKNKYVPVFISNATDAGKPKSLELRIIPNDFVFNGKLTELLAEIESGDLFKRPVVDPTEFFNKLIDKYEELQLSEIIRGVSKYKGESENIEIDGVEYIIPTGLLNNRSRLRDEKRAIFEYSSDNLIRFLGLNLDKPQNKLSYFKVLNYLYSLIPAVEPYYISIDNRTYKIKNELVNNSNLLEAEIDGLHAWETDNKSYFLQNNHFGLTQNSQAKRNVYGKILKILLARINGEEQEIEPCSLAEQLARGRQQIASNRDGRPVERSQYLQDLLTQVEPVRPINNGSVRWGISADSIVVDEPQEGIGDNRFYNRYIDWQQRNNIGQSSEEIRTTNNNENNNSPF